MEVDVNKRNSNKQHNDIDLQKASTFPLQINIENNTSCLKQFNNFMKNVTFTFN
jgi:hypothetical protein